MGSKTHKIREIRAWLPSFCSRDCTCYSCFLLTSPHCSLPYCLGSGSNVSLLESHLCKRVPYTTGHLCLHRIFSFLSYFVLPYSNDHHHIYKLNLVFLCLLLLEFKLYSKCFVTLLDCYILRAHNCLSILSLKDVKLQNLHKELIMLERW